MSAAAAHDQNLDDIFSALADPTRRRLLGHLATGPQSVGQLAEPIAMSLPAVSKHVKILERAGLVRREKLGRVHRIHLTAKPMTLAKDFIDVYRAFWEDNLDQLANYLESELEDK